MSMRVSQTFSVENPFIEGDVVRVIKSEVAAYMHDGWVYEQPMWVRRNGDAQIFHNLSKEEAFGVICIIRQ